MGYNKSIDSSAINTDLTSIANAIRAKTGGSGQLAFPNGFISEINNISGGGSSYAVCIQPSRFGRRPNYRYAYVVPSGFDPYKISDIYGYDGNAGYRWFHMKPTSGYILPNTEYGGYMINLTSVSEEGIYIYDALTQASAIGANGYCVFVMEKGSSSSGSGGSGGGGGISL